MGLYMAVELEGNLQAVMIEAWRKLRASFIALYTAFVQCHVDASQELRASPY